MFSYGYRQPVVDGWLIDHLPPRRITTALAQTGIVFEAGEDGIVRDPQSMYGALMSNFLRGQIAQPAVGFFGATEVQLRHGPIRTGTPYVKTGRVVTDGEPGLDSDYRLAG